MRCGHGFIRGRNNCPVCIGVAVIAEGCQHGEKKDQCAAAKPKDSVDFHAVLVRTQHVVRDLVCACIGFGRGTRHDCGRAGQRPERYPIVLMKVLTLALVLST